MSYSLGRKLLRGNFPAVSKDSSKDYLYVLLTNLTSGITRSCGSLRFNAQSKSIFLGAFIYVHTCRNIDCNLCLEGLVAHLGSFRYTSSYELLYIGLANELNIYTFVGK